jgi:YbbR domain-containing protein
MWNHVKNILLVTLVTVIIWVFAESESLRTVQIPPVDISILPVPNADYTVDVAESAAVHGNVVRVDLSLEGPAAALDTVQALLRQPIVVNPGEGFSSEKGAHSVSLQDVLRAKLNLAGRGVSIKSVSPESVNVTIDKLVKKTVKIDVEFPPGTELDGPAELKSSTASITLAESDSSKINDNTSVIARIDSAAMSRLNPGRKETITGVRLYAPPELAQVARLKIDPASVDVSLTLRTKTATIKVPSVPVHIRIAPGELSKWDIDIPEQDRFLTDVTVSGPSDAVKQVQDKSLLLVATVPLSFEELEHNIPSKDATIGALVGDLPPGLRFDVANKTVRLKIKKRENGGVPSPATQKP